MNLSVRLILVPGLVSAALLSVPDAVAAVGASAGDHRCVEKTDPDCEHHDRPRDGLAEVAELIPPDVHLVLHVRDGAALREQLAAFGVGDVLEGVIDDSDVGKAWSHLAENADISERELFDELLGRELTLAVERNHKGTAAWAAFTRVPDLTWAGFIKRIRPKLLSSKFEVPLSMLPEHELLFARHGELSIIGPHPKAAPSLVHRALYRTGHDARSLDRAESLRMATDRLAGDQVIAILHHERPMGGFSAIGLTVQDHTCTVEQIGRYVDSPWAHAPQSIEFNAVLLETVGRDRVGIIAQRLRFPAGRLGAFLQSKLPQGAVTDLIRNSLRTRMMFVFDETPAGALSGAVLIEIENQPGLAGDLDRLMTSTLNHLRDAVDAPGRRDDPARWERDDIQVVRVLPAGEVAERIFPFVPEAEQSTLSWRIVDAPDAPDWLVIASREALASELAAALVEFVPAERVIEVPAQHGWMDGKRAGAHLATMVGTMRRWIDDRDRRDHREMRSAIDMLSTIARIIGSARRIEWSIATPGANEVEATWSIDLR